MAWFKRVLQALTTRGRRSGAEQSGPVPDASATNTTADDWNDATSDDVEENAVAQRPTIMDLLVADIQSRGPAEFSSDALRIALIYEHPLIEVALMLDGLLTEAGVVVDADYRHHSSEYQHYGWVPFMDSIIGHSQACVLLRSEESVRAGIGTTPGLGEELAFAQLIRLPVFDTIAEGWTRMSDMERRHEMSHYMIPWLRENARSLNDEVDHPHQ